MPPVKQAFSNWTRQHPNQLPALAVAAFILVTSLWVGSQARSMTKLLATKRATWQQVSDQLAIARQQFKVPNSSESAALLAESARLGALGVPAPERVSLMELVARLAEESTLSDVRVNFRTGVDSAFIPPRSIGADAINPAGYSVSVDFTGSFAGLVQFVSSLPPSVSVSWVGAARNGGHATYHVLLAVYELPNGDHAN